MKAMLRISAVLFATAFCFVLMGAIALGQQTVGPNNAGTGADNSAVGSVAWGNPGNITTVGSPYATMSVGHGATTHYLQGSNYGFAIPSNASIVGITVVINRQSSGVQSPFLRDSRVSLVKAVGGVQTTNKAATGTNWSTSGLATATYGGAADMWGTTWTPAEINASGFGVVLSAVNSNGSYSRTATVDYMQISVTYTVPLPIQMVGSAANVVRDNQVEVTWKTVSETNNYGFEIYRKRGESGDWLKVDFVQGHGTTLAPQSYSYIDASLSFGKYYYQIRQVDLDGTSETFPAMEVTVGAATQTLTLAQNYPNPFNPSTVIEFVVPMSGHATMTVYNVLGQEVATLFEGNAEAGRINTARFNASNLPSGLYFYTLRSAGQTETKRMLLTK
jgi:hypothetical protein